jgi:hypothetical protein
MSPFNAKDFLGALTNHATTKDRGNKLKSTGLHHTSKMEDLIISLPTDKNKREAPSLHYSTSHWLHGNSIPKIGCHYFWHSLIALPTNTLTILTLPYLLVGGA